MRDGGHGALVDGARNELFARATFAKNQHVLITLGDEGKTFAQLPKRSTFTHDSITVRRSKSVIIITVEARRGPQRGPFHDEKKYLILKLKAGTNRDVASVEESATVFELGTTHIVDLHLIVAKRSQHQLTP